MKKYLVVIFSFLIVCSTIFIYPEKASDATKTDYDIIVLGSTPGGIMSAISAARYGKSVLIIERNNHIGGLPANGLGICDINTIGATQGLFAEFIHHIWVYYNETYGADSSQVAESWGGFRFEPHVAEAVFIQMLDDYKANITVLHQHQFDALTKNVKLKDNRLTAIIITDRQTGIKQEYKAKVFIDASYEGDLAAAAGAPYRLGREGRKEFQEPRAGKLYLTWGSDTPGRGSTGKGDQGIQAYNYRLTLTQNQENMVKIWKPKNYNREHYISLIEDLNSNLLTGKQSPLPLHFESIGRVVNLGTIPNHKYDANNQQLSFISTDLPNENNPWPIVDWEWRDNYAKNLKTYIIGLLWFVQNDPAVPKDFREKTQNWGLARDEYADNGHFPRQVYVREGRRIQGEYLFTAHDALPRDGKNARPPVYKESITASHYALDSHGIHKREPGRVNLDGMFSMPTKPYTVPFGVILPQKIEGLLTPVPVSGTHIGFSTLRMEPCWMALGQAAGTAAALSISQNKKLRDLDIWDLQQELLTNHATLVYFQDIRPWEKYYKELQYFALRDFFPNEWSAHLNDIVTEKTTKKWINKAGIDLPDGYKKGKTTRGELLAMMYELIN